MPHPCEHIKESRTPHGNRLRHALLHSRALHVVLLTLLIVDALICIFSGVLESQFYEGTAKDLTDYICKKNTNKNAVFNEITGVWLGTPEFSCRPPVPLHHRRLSAAAHGTSTAGSQAGAHGNSSGGHAGAGAHAPRSASMCNDDIKHNHKFGNHDLHTAEITLAKISAAILVFFLLEQMVLITELRSEYFKPMFVLDLFVICSSLVVEILLITNAWGIGASSGLLVIARVWRFARVGHGMLASSEEVEEIIEKDTAVESMEVAWSKLSDARWKEIKKGKATMTAAELQATLTPEELELVQELAKSPAVALRALAFARSFKKMHDKKMQQKGALPGLMGKDLEKFGVPEASSESHI